MKKLKGDIARKEGMLNAMQAELDKVSLPLQHALVIRCCDCLDIHDVKGLTE